MIGTTEDDGPTGAMAGLSLDTNVNPDLMKQNVNLPHGFSSIELLAQEEKPDNFFGKKMDSLGYSHKMQGGVMPEEPGYDETLEVRGGVMPEEPGLYDETLEVRGGVMPEEPG